MTASLILAIVKEIYIIKSVCKSIKIVFLDLFTVFLRNTYTFTRYFSLKPREILVSIPFYYCLQICLTKEKSILKFFELKLISYKKNRLFI